MKPRRVLNRRRAAWRARITLLEHQAIESGDPQRGELLLRQAEAARERLAVIEAQLNADRRQLLLRHRIAGYRARATQTRNLAASVGDPVKAATLRTLANKFEKTAGELAASLLTNP